MGPRALVHRFILADPIWRGVKGFVNELVKMYLSLCDQRTGGIRRRLVQYELMGWRQRRQRRGVWDVGGELAASRSRARRVVKIYP